MTRTFHIRTYGCQMNEHDSERIAGLLLEDGLEVAASEADADVVVLNTCCIRENADNKLYGHLGELKARKTADPDFQVMVAGCLAQKDRDRIRERAGHVDVVFGTHNVGRAAELRRAAETGGPIVEILEAVATDDAEAFPSALPTRRELAHAAWVTIQVGCDNHCAFCIVPAVRGEEMSRPFGELVAEIETLAADGVHEITLLGQNVNSYGRDLTLQLRGRTELGPDAMAVTGRRWVDDGDRRPRPLFSDLLRSVGAVDGVDRVRFTSPHPKDLRADTIEAMAETPAVCEHLHFPLQSGSDRVLAAMHRGYTAERYLERVVQARDGIDDLAITTDIIVGFPGETADDFEATLAVASEVGYDSAFTFVFSPREGTEAAGLTDRFVDSGVAAERMARLRVVIERSALQRNQDRVGRTEELIVEGPSKKDPSRLTGRTRQNKLVHFDAPQAYPAGSVVQATVTKAAPFHLSGELTQVVRIPRRRRVPIPVLSG